jgi:hypothetical protein
MSLSPWPLVAAVYNLEVAEGLRDGPFISGQTARRVCLRAIDKLKRALVKQGVDAATVDAYFRLNDELTVRHHANLAALLPPPGRVRDDGDPSRHRSLRRMAAG